RAFFPDTVYDLEDICTKIAIELKNQYVIGYHSTNEAKDGKWRKLRMKVNPPKGINRLNVRYKQGYYAPTTPAAPTGKDYPAGHKTRRYNESTWHVNLFSF